MLDILLLASPPYASGHDDFGGFLMKIQKTRIKRFPRLVEVNEGIALSKLMWREPDFTLELDGPGRSIDFIFRVSVGKRSARHFPLAVNLLFDSGSEYWKKTLIRTFQNAKSGEKSVLHFISILLGGVHRKAMRAWVADTWRIIRRVCPDTKEFKWKEKGPQPDPRLALKVTLRYEVVLQALKEFKFRLKKNARSKAPEILSEQRLKWALEQVASDDRLATVTARGVSISRVAEAYLRSEFEREIQFASARPSIRTYLKFGRQLRDATVRLKPKR